jgi:DNA topoisomerase IB
MAAAPGRGQVRLLEITLIRVGNEEYARVNASFGLTTLRRRHVAVSGEELRFHFRGKSGKEHSLGIRDRRLSRIVKRCQELPGQELFRYVDRAGRRRNVGSADVNAYLRALSGRDFTAKDFRTWAGTVRAAYALNALEPFSSGREAKRNLAREQAVLDMLTWDRPHGRGARGGGERGSAGAQRPRVPARRPGRHRRRSPDGS